MFYCCGAMQRGNICSSAYTSFQGTEFSCCFAAKCISERSVALWRWKWQQFCIELLGLYFFQHQRSLQLKGYFHQHCGREHTSAVQLLLWCCVSVPSSTSWSCQEPKWKPNLTLENLSFPLLLNSGQQCVASKILKVRGRLKNWKPEATPLMPV